MSRAVFNQIAEGLREVIEIAATDAPKGKGSEAVASAAPIQDLTMLNVVDAPPQGKAKAAAHHTISGTRAASLWLSQEVIKAATKLTTQVIDLTPDLATAMLERNPENRKLSDAQVDQFARDIVSGNWAFNGESIIVSSDGLLNDGQHRCAAVVKAKKSIPVVLVVGAERETRTTLDQGKNRLISDYLAMDGHVGAPILASAAYIAWQVERYGFTTRASSFRPTKGELMAFIAANGSIERSVQRIPQYGVKKIGGRPSLAFCHWHLSKWANPTDAEYFIEKLLTGHDLKKGDPILYIRNRLMNLAGLTVAERVELIIRGWNLWRRGEANVTRIPLTGGKLPDVEA